MQSFHDVRFPTAISFGATGGPVRRNEIVTLTSGREKRNLRTAHSRRRFDVGTGVRSLADLQEIVAFFEARRGSFHGFRFRDPFDMKSCAPDGEPAANDQTIGTGDGETRSFPLTKAYGEGEDLYERPVTRPVEGSVIVAVNGAPREAGVDFDIGDGGLVVFAETAVPPAGAPVTAGFLFDLPVRFDADRVEVNLAGFRAGQIPSIPILEILE